MTGGACDFLTKIDFCVLNNRRVEIFYRNLYNLFNQTYSNSSDKILRDIQIIEYSICFACSFLEKMCRFRILNVDFVVHIEKKDG